MRSLVGVGTPRSLQGHLATIVALVSCGRAWSAAGATTTRHPTIRRPFLRRIIVSSCYLLARQKATFNHGLLGFRFLVFLRIVKRFEQRRCDLPVPVAEFVVAAIHCRVAGYPELDLDDLVRQ